MKLYVTVDLLLFKMGQFVPWLQSGHRTVRLFLLVAVLVSVKQLRNVHQILEDSVTLLSSIGLGYFSFSIIRKTGTWKGFCTGRGEATGFCSVSLIINVTSNFLFPDNFWVKFSNSTNILAVTDIKVSF